MKNTYFSFHKTIFDWRSWPFLDLILNDRRKTKSYGLIFMLNDAEHVNVKFSKVSWRSNQNQKFYDGYMLIIYV